MTTEDLSQVNTFSYDSQRCRRAENSTHCGAAAILTDWSRLSRVHWRHMIFFLRSALHMRDTLFVRRNKIGRSYTNQCGDWLIIYTNAHLVMIDVWGRIQFFFHLHFGHFTLAQHLRGRTKDEYQILQ